MKPGNVFIGWDKIDITPNKKVMIFGQLHPRISNTVVSPLTATALALETRNEKNEPIDQAILVSCDLGNIKFKDKLLDRLSGRVFGFDLNKLSINVTHTHNAPGVENGCFPEPEDPDFMSSEAYQDFLLDRLTQLIVTAWDARKPGGISPGFDHAAVGHCRRAVYMDGSALMYGETSRSDFVGMEGYEDHAVNMLFTWNENNDLTGIVLNIACPAQVDEAGNFVSADFWHEVREEIRQWFPSEIFLLPQCSAAGDQSPHFLINKKEEANLRRMRGLSRKEVIAKKIMQAIVNAYEAAGNNIANSLIMKHAVKKYVLPLRMVSDSELSAEKEMLAKGGKPWPFGLIGNLIERYEYQQKIKSRTFESHLIRVGDVVFATNPFELFLDFGICIKARSAAMQTFIVQLSNATEFYLPTEKAVTGGHYSAIVKSGWVGPEGGRKLTDLTVDSINKMFSVPPEIPDATMKG